MKGFRFPLQTLLDLEQRRLEKSEERRRRLADEQAGSLGKARGLEQEAMTALAEASGASRLSGAAARATAQWVRHLGDQRRSALDRASRLHQEEGEARKQLVEQRRRVRLLETLREKRRREHRALEDRQQQALADELFLARRVRGG